MADKMNPGELATLPILSLAYLGDAVFEELVREHLVRHSSLRPSELNSRALRFVTATAQSGAMECLLERLTPEEADIYRRGRNAKTRSTSRRTNNPHYHAATGLECVFGYLKLVGESGRIQELFEFIVQARQGMA